MHSERTCSCIVVADVADLEEEEEIEVLEELTEDDEEGDTTLDTTLETSLVTQDVKIPPEMLEETGKNGGTGHGNRGTGHEIYLER